MVIYATWAFVIKICCIVKYCAWFSPQLEHTDWERSRDDKQLITEIPTLALERNRDILCIAFLLLISAHSGDQVQI